MEFISLSQLDAPVKMTEKYISKHFNEFYDYICNNYNFCKSFKEKLYCYFNNIDKQILCPICEKPVNFISFKDGYRVYCSNKCASKSEDRIAKIKTTKALKYGDPNYNNSTKIKSTCLMRYGATTPLLNDECIKKTKETCLKKYGSEDCRTTEVFKAKVKNSFFKKYGVINCFQDPSVKEKIKNTMTKKYGVDNITKTQQYKNTIIEKHDTIQEKIYQTKKANKSFNISKPEVLFAEYLKTQNIDFKTQYKSDVYPFMCDFYISPYDLYIELQSNWTHGPQQYNINDTSHNELLQKWKNKNTQYYNNAIETWTKRDVLKRKTAKKNNINYLEIFSNNIREIISIYNTFTTNQLKK